MVAPGTFSVAVSFPLSCAGTVCNGSARRTSAIVKRIRLRRRNPMNDRLPAASVGCSRSDSRRVFLAVGTYQCINGKLARAEDQDQQRDQQEREWVRREKLS